MKSYTKNLIIFLVIFLFTVSFSGCNYDSGSASSEKNQSNTKANQIKSSEATQLSEKTKKLFSDVKLPITDKPVTLTVFMGMDSNVIGIIDDYNKNAFYKELEKRTGVHLKFIMPPMEKEQEVYDEMILSGNLADIITHDGNAYPDGWDAAVDDGYYLNLTPYLDTYLKDYKRIINSDPTLRKSALTGSGKVAALYRICTEPQGPWIGLQVRKDWLDDLGLDTPVTFDDWENMLTLFKEKKGAYAPLSIGQNGYMQISHAMSAGFGVLEDFMQVNGKVEYGPIMDGWKEYLTLLNRWYDKGLIDPEFMINGAWQVNTSMVVEDKTGAWNAMYTMISQYEKTNPGMKVIPVASPVKKAGDKLHIRKETHNMENAVAISAKCKYPDIAMKLLDYLYTEEGAMLANYGIENDTFKYNSEGKPVVTDKITHNPKYSVGQAQALYLLSPSKFPCLYDWTRELASVPKKDIKAYDIWSTADDAYIIPDGVSYLEGEESERSGIVSNVTSYMNDCTVKFITGVLDINTDWKNYVDTIDGMGIERAIKITQNALDRYNNK